MRFYYLILLVALLSCNDDFSSDNLGVYKEAELAIAYDSEENYEAVEESVALETPDSESKIIKTANIMFETADVASAHARVLALVRSNGGFVQRDNTGKSYNRVYRQMVLRVPTSSFQALIDSIGKGVAYFDQKDISRRDVSEEFVDLEARLKTKKELEKRYLELLTKAKNVTEMLEIERELANIREEIEAKEGRLKYLQDQVSLSTVNLEFYTNNQETGVTVSYGRKMANALKGGWNGISSFFLGLLYLWPLAIFIAVGVYFLRRYLKRRKH